MTWPWTQTFNCLDSHWFRGFRLAGQPPQGMLRLGVLPFIPRRSGGFIMTYSAAEASIDQLKNKIQQREARVGIIGLGYVGLPLALLYSEKKFKVTGFDIDSRKVETLAKGGSYIYRILPEEI